MLCDSGAQPMPHIAGAQRPIGPQDIALAGMFVQHRQHPQGPATDGGVRKEIPRPYMPAMGGLGGEPRGGSTTATLSFRRRYAQAFRPTQPLNLTLAHAPAFAVQQRGEPPIPIAGMLRREFPQPFPSLFRGRRGWPTAIPIRRP